MRKNAVALMLVAIVAIGIFALPQSIALFSGQHSWYDLDGDGNQVPCIKCHQDINDEMMGGENGIHSSMGETCLCHRVNNTRIATGVADGDGALTSNPGTTSHAAETIACMVCHEQGHVTYPFAGGFNQSAVEDAAGVESPYYYDHSDGSGGEHAAHNQFIGEAIKDPLMEDSNEACIACHTRVGVNITWTKNEIMSFVANEDADGIWTVTDFAAEGSNITYVNSTNDWTE